MQRVLVVGGPGAGKSWLAGRLAESLDLPLVHLDQHYWQPGWVEPDNAAWQARVAALAAEPRWVIDGNYAGSLPPRLARADGVVFLDLPRRVRLRRILWRSLRNYGRVRADLGAGCPERFDWDFLRYAWHFERDHRPQLLQALQAFEGDIQRLTDRGEAEAFLATATRGTTSAAAC